MIEGIFFRLGRLTYRFRIGIIILWILIILGCLPYVPHFMDPFRDTGFKDPKSESALTESYVNKHLKFNTNRFVVLYESQKLNTDDAQFQTEIKNSLKNLKKDFYTSRIIYPDKDNNQISSDKRSAYAVVLFENKVSVDEAFLKKFKNKIIKPEFMTFKIGGEQAFIEDTRYQTQKDLFKAEYIATPVTIITMLIVFGSVVAAGLPIVLGFCFAIIIFAILFHLGNMFPLSVFTVNIALLLGLCINLDYALLYISRFRFEIRKNKPVEEAIIVTQATAGKAIFYSGLTVLVSLSALLFFPINILVSVGLGGVVSVLVALANCVILLPAILSVLGKKINLWPIPFLQYNTSNYWHWIVSKVVSNSWKLFFLIFILLLVLSYPFAKAQLGISDMKILPKKLESRQVYDIFKSNFGEGELAPISVVLRTSEGDILSRNNLNQVYAVAKKIETFPGVLNVTGIINKKPALSKNEYYNLYHTPEKYRTDSVKNLLELSTSKNFTVLTVVNKYGPNDHRTKELINKIRALDPGKNMSIKVSGASANTLDILNSISQKFVLAIIWVILITYLILLVLLRSLFLPLKAIVMNILSLTASYGVLAFIFQQGHFERLLNFQAQHILDISLLIIIFCSLFGFSMDYEVFLLTRIKEEYEKTKDNIKSTICGIEFSGRIITSAAIIVMMICFSFMSADILLVKAFGLGVAVAIFVDAFLIRIMLVPATMALLGEWNWYLPQWICRILPKHSYHHEELPDEHDNKDFY